MAKIIRKYKKVISATEYNSLTKINNKNPFSRFLGNEDKLHIEVKNFLTSIPQCLYFHAPDAAKRTPYDRYKMSMLAGNIKHFPDFFIINSNKQYKGLFIELKIDSPYLKDGNTLKANDHLVGQAETLELLEIHGYKAVFAWNMNQIKEIVLNYFKQ